MAAMAFRSPYAALAFVCIAVLSFASDVRGIGCPSNSSASSLRVLSEFLFHRPAETFGELFFDEQRDILLFSVNAEIWRIPINSSSTKIFVCNSTSRSFENSKAFAADTMNGIVHVGATQGLTQPMLYSLDYQGVQIQQQSVVPVPYVSTFAGAAKCVLFVNSTRTIVMAFRESGIVLLNADNPLQPVGLAFINPLAYSGANISSCILDEGSNRVHFIAKNVSTTLLISLQLGPNTISISTFPAALSSSENVIGVLAPDNNKLYLANSNITQFIQVNPNANFVPTYFNYTLPGFFQTVASDSFRKRIYYFLSNPWTPSYMFNSYEDIPPQGPFHIEPLYYAGYQTPITTYLTRNLTVHRAYFAKKQDLAFFVTDSLDLSTGVNIVAVSTSSCPDGNTLCSQTSQGNCGCYRNDNAVYPTVQVSCNGLYNDTYREAFPSNICPNNPVPVARPPAVVVSAPVSAPAVAAPSSEPTVLVPANASTTAPSSDVLSSQPIAVGSVTPRGAMEVHYYAMGVEEGVPQTGAHFKDTTLAVYYPLMLAVGAFVVSTVALEIYYRKFVTSRAR